MSVHYTFNIIGRIICQTIGDRTAGGQQTVRDRWRTAPLNIARGMDIDERLRPACFIRAAKRLSDTSRLVDRNLLFQGRFISELR